MTWTFNIVLAAFETLRHMLDFKSIVFCMGGGGAVGQQNLFK